MSEATGTTILGQNLDESETPEEPTAGDPQGSVFQQLVGEGKRYADQEILAKSKLEADSFIERLKQEKQEVENKLREISTKANIESELMEAIRSLQKNQQHSTETPTSNQNEESTVTPEKLQEMVEQVLNSKEAQNKLKMASDEAWAKLGEKLGSMAAAKERVRKYIDGDTNKAQSLELLGRTDPEGFVTFIMNRTKVDGVASEPSDGAGYTTEQSFDGKLTWKKALEIRKTNPEVFKSRGFQTQLHKAASENPNFYNN